VTGTLTEDGWVVDKGDITDIISDWDHRFLLEQGDPLIEAFDTSGDSDAVVVLDHPPTAEVMSLVLEQRLRRGLPDSVSDVTVEVQETGELAAGAPQ
jgi:6-pyruvoyltetrahydropterin/6-carboxytetrahydropterin synthase